MTMAVVMMALVLLVVVGVAGRLAEAGGLGIAMLAVLLYVLAVAIGGAEEVAAPRGTRRIVVRQLLFGIGVWRREFELDGIRRLRVLPDAGYGFWGGGDRRAQDWIAFDYGEGMVRLGRGVEEAEAEMIVEALRERLGFGWW